MCSLHLAVDRTPMIIMGGSAKVNVPEGTGSAVDNNQEGSTDINVNSSGVNIPLMAGAFAAGNPFLICFLVIMASIFTTITVSPIF